MIQRWPALNNARSPVVVVWAGTPYLFGGKLIRPCQPRRLHISQATISATSLDFDLNLDYQISYSSLRTPYTFVRIHLTFRSIFLSWMSIPSKRRNRAPSDHPSLLFAPGPPCTSISAYSGPASRMRRLRFLHSEHFATTTSTVFCS